MAQPVAPNLNINIDPSRYKANLLNAQQIADLWGWQNAESYANQNADQKFNAKKTALKHNKPQQTEISKMPAERLISTIGRIERATRKECKLRNQCRTRRATHGFRRYEHAK